MMNENYYFLQQAHDALVKRFGKLEDYRELKIPNEFRRMEGAYSQKTLVWEAFAFAARGVLYGRVVLIRGADSWINNIVVFPANGFATPILGIEMLGFRNRIHLIVADLFPLVAQDENVMEKIATRYDAVGETPPMPVWATKIFSPHPVFRKPRNSEDIETAARVMSEVGAEWLALAQQARSETDLQIAGQAQFARDEYVRCHAEDEPAEPFLTRAFGEEIGLRLIHDFLFPSDWQKKSFINYG